MKSSTPRAAFLPLVDPHHVLEAPRPGARAGRRRACSTSGPSTRGSRPRCPAPPASASSEGQRGRKPRFLWMVAMAREVRVQGSRPFEEAAPLREGREALEPRHEHVGVGKALHELRRARRLRQELGPEGLRRRSPRAPRAAGGRARPRGCGPGPAAPCARPRGRSPRGGCPGRGPPAARRRPRPGARTATPPRPRRTARSASASSAVRKPGTTPHSSGRSWRMAAQRAWMVETWARSSISRAGRRSARARPRAASPSARARSSRSRRRSFRVVAAFSVKVTAAISSRRAWPLRMSRSMRSTSRVVLPVPAPASSTRLVRVVGARALARVFVHRPEAAPSQHVPQARGPASGCGRPACRSAGAR